MNKLYKTRRYIPEDYAVWNDFVTNAKNATFLFHRDFMEYHSDRFVDYSLMVFDDSKLCAVVPANYHEGKVYSHLGLTYGGITFMKGLKFSESLRVYRSVLQFLTVNSIICFVLKITPKMYCKEATDELDYLLFLTDASLIRSDLSIAIDQSGISKIQSNRMEGVKKGRRSKLIIREDGGFKSFWHQLLIPNLEARYHSSPTHSCEEIIKLSFLFPEQIRQFNVYYKEKLVAGATVFATETVAHVQYISANSQKQQLGSLDYLFHFLIKDVFADKQYFDFGTSSENSGRAVNKGLLYWKECFGGKGHVHNSYEVRTEKYIMLDHVL